MRRDIIIGGIGLGFVCLWLCSFLAILSLGGSLGGVVAGATPTAIRIGPGATPRAPIPTAVPMPTVPTLPVGTSLAIKTAGGGIAQAAVAHPRGGVSITLTGLRVFEEAVGRDIRRRAYIDGYITVTRLYGNVGADIFTAGNGEAWITLGDNPNKRQAYAVIRVDDLKGIVYFPEGRTAIALVLDGGIPLDPGVPPKYKIEVKIPGMAQPIEGWLSP